MFKLGLDIGHITFSPIFCNFPDFTKKHFRVFLIFFWFSQCKKSPPKTIGQENQQFEPPHTHTLKCKGRL
jgi:hypothetical protein